MMDDNAKNLSEIRITVYIYTYSTMAGKKTIIVVHN